MRRFPDLTTDDCIAYTNALNQYVAFDRAISCPLCVKCLADKRGRCLYGGPFKGLVDGKTSKA